MPQSEIRRLKPLTVPQLRIAMEAGTITPEDILAIQWLRKARTPRLPMDRAGEMTRKIGAYVRAYREDHKLTCREFGELCGLSGSRVTQIETGSREHVSLGCLIALAEGCNATLRCEIVPRKARNAKTA